MRIGTWNLAGRWTPDHASLLDEMDCDVLLLTEVNERLALPDYARHTTAALMAARRHWSAVLARGSMTARPDPHFATAAAEVDDIRFLSSILPWRGCGELWPGRNTHVRTALALQQLEHSLDTARIVWGGDWNHALSGPEYAGSRAGREDILRTTAGLGLQIPTAALAHRIRGLLSIDHIAVPSSWTVTQARHVVAIDDEGRRLSDHDAYVVAVDS